MDDADEHAGAPGRDIHEDINLSPEDLLNVLRERVATRLSDLKLTPITAATGAGLPRDTFRNLYREGGNLPRIDTLIKMASALETTVAYLVNETTYPRDDYNEEDLLYAARHAIETARPIPIIGYAGWGIFAVPRKAAEPFDLVHLGVPSFQDKPLLALVIVDDHADLFYPKGRIVVYAPREATGLRDMDHVVVMRQVGDEVEFTVRALLTSTQRAKNGEVLIGGGYVTLASDDKAYPNYGFYMHTSKYEELFPEVVGVVVADVNFLLRPAGDALFTNIQTTAPKPKRRKGGEPTSE